MTSELLYSHDSVLIVVILFLAIMLANEIGFRVGRYYQKNTHPEIKNQTIAIQAGTLGLLALLLGFTFNMSLERYEQRTMNQVEEASSIETALLRAELLPEPYNKESKALLKKYLDMRIDFGAIGSLDKFSQETYDSNIDIIQKSIWDIAVKVTSIDSRQVTIGMYILALNTMIDAENKRAAVFILHVPEPILWTLFIIFLSTGALMGYSSGLSYKRAFIPTLIMTLLIVLVVLIVIDLDRPKRGIIKVSQESLMRLKNK